MPKRLGAATKSALQVLQELQATFPEASKLW
jgi:hypothetical protein